MDAVLLAGGGKCPADDALCPGQYRALLDISGKPMMQYIIDALQQSGQIEKIYIVGNQEAYAPIFAGRENVELLADTGTIVGNVAAGMERCAPGFVLLATIDIPLITGEIVKRFIDECLKTSEYRFFYPVIEQSINEKAFPETKRTYFRMKEGNYTGGNIVLIHTDMLATHREKFADLLTHRKSAAKMALDIGIITLVKMLLGKLPLLEAEKRACKALQVKGKAMISYDAEICLDVDKPSDLAEVLKNLR
ncbi:MAG: nucleotidyltransferase family protein [Firmicutes bacterium]|nr:nucleotidyltransferase family protein [Bacillota bacterium]